MRWWRASSGTTRPGEPLMRWTYQGALNTAERVSNFVEAAEMAVVCSTKELLDLGGWCCLEC